MSGRTPPEHPAPVCYRHPERASYLRCSRCDRSICADCMHSAAVGQHCGECARAGATTVGRRRVRIGAGQPAVSYALIGLNVLMFGVQGVSPALGRELVLWSPAVADGQFYRLVTAVFLHYGLLHLLVNMWALYVVGPALEMMLGRWRFGALYGLSALGGSVAVFLLAPLNTATAGASGAVFGLFGATLVAARRLRLDVGWVVAVIVINLVFTFSIPHISWQGHVGGLVTGTGVMVAYGSAPRRRRSAIQVAVGLAVLALCAVLIGWRAAELATQLGLR